jgi:hypothetical protein
MDGRPAASNPSLKCSIGPSAITAPAAADFAVLREDAELPAMPAAPPAVAHTTPTAPKRTIVDLCICAPLLIAVQRGEPGANSMSARSEDYVGSC